MPTLLIVDDEPSILTAFRRAFRDWPLNLVTAETAYDGLALAREHHPDVIILDVRLPDMSGLEALRSLRALDARSPVIFITGKSTTDTAIEAMKLGAYEYLLKPLELAQLRQVIQRALDISRLMHVPAVVAEADAADERADAIIGRCPAMQDVYKAIGRVAGQDVTVLITGESGTGKELVARAIYQHSRRATGPFLAINCAAIPEQLLESELFGHEKGAFTGADRRRIGKFEQCTGGTIFLDEVADMSPLTQSKVLRLLQEQQFERVGGNETLQSDVRVLAASNQDLEALVAAGRFRQDLYYRLSVFTIRLPGLRERGDDLLLLVKHYLRRFNRELGKDVQQIAPEAMALLRDYPWPGNIRELQSVLKQALLLAAGPILVPDFLPASLRKGGADRQAAALASQPQADALDGFAAFAPHVEARLKEGAENLYEEMLRRMERLLLTRVLQHTGGNQLQAAKILGITRGSLRTKIRDLGITIARTISGSEEPEE
ncbi:MAG: sigma-54-dependent Fis family transcriptional regulator [Planctomycetota bacterium]|nr:MAG: sigma-54-dependent Fis family transcriptional regulator [Planctomycetota bacterium]